MTDSESGAISQEEIAQQFMLPERQVKVNQLLRTIGQGGGGSAGGAGAGGGPPKSSDEVEYCICRSSDVTRFMIGCDHCNEWYHGDCIGVTQQDAKSIIKFYCSKCREKDPRQQIRYKVKKKDKDRDKDKDRFVSESSDTERPMSRREREKMAKAKKSSRRCGECVACHRKEDCARCDFCKDMKKFGGPNRIRQKCRLRQCLNFAKGLIMSGNRWKHRSKDPSDHGTPSSQTESDHPTMTDDLSGSDYPIDSDSLSENEYKPEMSKEHRFSLSESPSPARKKTKIKKKEKKDKYKQAKEKKQKPKVKDKKPSTKAKHHRRRHLEIELDTTQTEEEEVARQCYGPGCTEHARDGSKYCSDKCGMKLAENRIYEILPSKIQSWQATPCIAEENNKFSLEKIRRQQMLARSKLGELDLRHQELDALIERAKHATIAPEQEGTDGEDEAELSVFCVTCGHEINQRGALKHMEKCFGKFEGQTSFGSIYKTRIEGNSMFCDVYNSQSKTYCKRLKVLCPEHSKEPKVSADEVCGCPLVSNVFEDTGEFCRVPKRKCNKHYCWEKLRRAEIDMERVRQWLKLDELFEQERNIRLAMANRAGVLGLMLHQSIDHDPMNPIKTPN